MKKFWFMLAIPLAGCSGAQNDRIVQFEGKSDLDFDDVTTCISQDIESVFPRLFPAGENEYSKTFRSYDGLYIDIRRAQESVILQLRWDHALTSRQVEYLRFCLERAHKNK